MSRDAQKEFEKVQAALNVMKPGETRHVRVSPGRQGLITIRKPHPNNIGPFWELGQNKQKAKVIGRKEK